MGWENFKTGSISQRLWRSFSSLDFVSLCYVFLNSISQAAVSVRLFDLETVTQLYGWDGYEDTYEYLFDREVLAPH